MENRRLTPEPSVPWKSRLTRRLQGYFADHGRWKIHHLVPDDGGPVYWAARTIPLSTLEREAAGLG